MMPEAVILAALQAYSKTIDLIVSIRADIPEDLRKKEWERHFARVQWWEDQLAALLKEKPDA